MMNGRGKRRARHEGRCRLCKRGRHGRLINGKSGGVFVVSHHGGLGRRLEAHFKGDGARRAFREKGGTSTVLTLRECDGEATFTLGGSPCLLGTPDLQGREREEDCWRI